VDRGEQVHDAIVGHADDHRQWTIMFVDRQTLLQACNAELQPERFRDWGPNGLQVEGKPSIGKLVSGASWSAA